MRVLALVCAGAVTLAISCGLEGARADGQARLPTILSVAASEDLISAAGETAVVTARSEAATVCTFRGAGLNTVEVPCSSGVARVRIKFSANESANERVWSVFVRARNSIGQSSSSRAVRLTQLAAFPAPESSTGGQTAPPATTTPSVAPPVVNLDACLPGPNCYYGPIYERYQDYGNVAPASLGDCSFAAAADWEQIVLGTDPDPSVIGYEFAEAGGSSAGLALSALWAYWQQQGIAGVHLNGTSSYYTDQTDVENGVRDYRAMLVLFQFVPNDGFGAQTVPAGEHVAVVDGFTPEGPLVVTWGQTIQMSWTQWSGEVVGMWGINAS